LFPPLAYKFGAFFSKQCLCHLPCPNSPPPRLFLRTFTSPPFVQPELVHFPVAAALEALHPMPDGSFTGLPDRFFFCDFSEDQDTSLLVGVSYFAGFGFYMAEFVIFTPGWPQAVRTRPFSPPLRSILHVFAPMPPLTDCQAFLTQFFPGKPLLPPSDLSCFDASSKTPPPCLPPSFWKPFKGSVR